MKHVHKGLINYKSAFIQVHNGLEQSRGQSIT